MGLRITNTVKVQPKSELSLHSPSGVYQSRDGSVAVKGDSDGKMKKGRPAVPATHVLVTSGKSGRTFIKPIDKLTDEYKFIGRNDQFQLVPTPGFNPVVRW